MKKFKCLLLHELVNLLRELIMKKRYLRKTLGRQWKEGILLIVMKDLNLIFSNLKVVKITISDDDIATVTILDNWNNQKRNKVDL